jgi:hypothetical protein
MIAAAHVHAILALAAATLGSSRREHAEDLEGGRSRSEPDRIVIHDLKPRGIRHSSGSGLATQGTFRAIGREICPKPLRNVKISGPGQTHINCIGLGCRGSPIAAPGLSS